MICKTAVFKKISEGAMTKKEFFAWLLDRDTEQYLKGERDGYANGKPKERYQGEFSVTGNY